MIIFCKLEMGKGMGLISTEEKMKKLENSEDLLKREEFQKSIDS